MTGAAHDRATRGSRTTARSGRGRQAKAATRLAVSVAAGFAVGAATWLLAGPVPGGLAGWDAATLVLVLWTWLVAWSLDSSSTRDLASREDPSQALSDVVVLVASVASLLAVTVVLFRGSSKGGAAVLQLGLGLLAVVACWVVVHTTFMLKYARTFYVDEAGGFDFHGDQPPTYRDFAYLAMTVGMTFQVSDTEVVTGPMRAAVLRHSLVAYFLGAVVIAITINLVAGLAR